MRYSSYLPTTSFAAQFGPAGLAFDYTLDAAQRSVLFWDVMRKRGNQYRAHAEATAPHVLSFTPEIVLDGRTLERPVNYALVRIVPPGGIEVDQTRRPFVVVDPRAGHGPGIGGFKADSEIGVALKAGHPCYFIGFLPQPVPGQTIEDIALAESVFLEKVISLHPQADAKPCVIGNCQAGWAVMMLAAMRPELFGSIIIAGAPLSYWAGERGKYPMRYTGGLLGGTWLTALTSDLGHGQFDGAWLVQNFENQNPANTLWTKQYNLYSKIDTEAPRYLGFEEWWGGHVSLNAEEIQFIVDELFVGNNLAAGRIEASNGEAIDLRSIRAPIVVFCSKGDNITPPAQALGWILDLYDDVHEIRSHGQTIVYTVHETIGHLGIFVSANVARKEHGEFSSNIDLIDALPPGLYEAIFEARTDETIGGDLVEGDWIMRCEARTLDDIRALGCNSAEDDRRFATVAKVSDINLSLYRTFVQPVIRAMVPEWAANQLRDMHPLRLQYELFSDVNPLMAPIADLAVDVADERRPVAADNPFLALEQAFSRQIVAGLDAWRDGMEALSEATFLSVYGSPLLQASVGIDPSDTKPHRRASKTGLHRQVLKAKIDELKAQIGNGGLREGLARSLLYVAMASGAADERGFAAIRRMRGAEDGMPAMTLTEFKALIRDQFLILVIDEEAAVSAIPRLLPGEEDVRRKALSALQEVLNARGPLSEEAERRWQRIIGLFDVAKEPLVGPVPSPRKPTPLKAVRRAN
jgi:pimeloyl-ACP methyl ester carboxylesterase